MQWMARILVLWVGVFFALSADAVWDENCTERMQLAAFWIRSRIHPVSTLTRGTLPTSIYNFSRLPSETQGRVVSELLKQLSEPRFELTVSQQKSLALLTVVPATLEPSWRQRFAKELARVGSSLKEHGLLPRLNLSEWLQMYVALPDATLRPELRELASEFTARYPADLEQSRFAVLWLALVLGDSPRFHSQMHALAALDSFDVNARLFSYLELVFLLDPWASLRSDAVVDLRVELEKKILYKLNDEQRQRWLLARAVFKDKRPELPAGHFYRLDDSGAVVVNDRLDVPAVAHESRLADSPPTVSTISYMRTALALRRQGISQALLALNGMMHPQVLQYSFMLDETNRTVFYRAFLASPPTNSNACVEAFSQTPVGRALAKLGFTKVDCRNPETNFPQFSVSWQASGNGSSRTAEQAVDAGKGERRVSSGGR